MCVCVCVCLCQQTVVVMLYCWSALNILLNSEYGTVISKSMCSVYVCHGREMNLVHVAMQLCMKRTKQGYDYPLFCYFIHGAGADINKRPQSCLFCHSQGGVRKFVHEFHILFCASHHIKGKCKTLTMSLILRCISTRKSQ